MKVTVVLAQPAKDGTASVASPAAGACGALARSRNSSAAKLPEAAEPRLLITTSTSKGSPTAGVLVVGVTLSMTRSRTAVNAFRQTFVFGE